MEHTIFGLRFYPALAILVLSICRGYDVDARLTPHTHWVRAYESQMGRSKRPQSDFSKENLSPLSYYDAYIRSSREEDSSINKVVVSTSSPNASSSTSSFPPPSPTKTRQIATAITNSNLLSIISKNDQVVYYSKPRDHGEVVVPIVGTNIVLLTAGSALAFVGVVHGIRWIVQQILHNLKFPTLISWKISTKDWVIMCRNQDPDFWKHEIVPQLLDREDDNESEIYSIDTDTWHLLLEQRPDLLKTIKYRMKYSMKYRKQLARKVTRILGRQWKNKRQQRPLDWSEPEQEIVAEYYAAITVERLHSVLEGLEEKLEQWNQTNLVHRYVDRYLLVEGLQARIEAIMRNGTYNNNGAQKTSHALRVLVEESALRDMFKDALREAIVTTD